MPDLSKWSSEELYNYRMMQEKAMEVQDRMRRENHMIKRYMSQMNAYPVWDETQGLAPATPKTNPLLLLLENP